MRDLDQTLVDAIATDVNAWNAIKSAINQAFLNAKYAPHAIGAAEPTREAFITTDNAQLLGIVKDTLINHFEYGLKGSTSIASALWSQLRDLVYWEDLALHYVDLAQQGKL